MNYLGINWNVEDEKENREEKLQQDQKDIEELHEKLEKKYDLSSKNYRRKELDKLEYEIKQLNLRKTIRMIEYMKSNEEFDKLKSQIK